MGDKLYSQIVEYELAGIAIVIRIRSFLLLRLLMSENMYSVILLMVWVAVTHQTKHTVLTV